MDRDALGASAIDEWLRLGSNQDELTPILMISFSISFTLASPLNVLALGVREK
jgi:hypothetical protein